MKSVILSFYLVVLLAACTTKKSPNQEQKIQEVSNLLSGTWLVQVENLQNVVTTKMRIRFTKEKANSCMAGNWRQVIVESHETSDKNFFPVTEPLSYELKNNRIVIGRNQVCDAYLYLDGELKNLTAQGEYVAFGWGSKKLGYFTLVQGSSDGT